MMGTERFVARCKALAKKHGSRFAPSNLLIEMAGKGESFYGRFGPGRRAAA
jgi:3-hydroxyacyl-CoA dehydrogenase/enoyl-CoA hydratase/3-hydroxybutyryl-CoA epimerase